MHPRRRPVNVPCRDAGSGRAAKPAHPRFRALRDGTLPAMWPNMARASEAPPPLGARIDEEYLELDAGGPREIEELLKAREPYYRECADCTVETAGRSAAEVASLIRAHLNLS